MTQPHDWGEPRSKTTTWYDPRAGARAGAELSGIEHLQAIRDGRLPPAPISQLIGSRIVGVEPGEVIIVCRPDESVYNPIGIVHGGVVCTLLDSVIGCAVQSTLALGSGYTSIEIKISYLRPVHAGAELTARGWVAKPGRRVAFGEGEVRDADGKLIASGSSSCLVFAR